MWDLSWVRLGCGVVRVEEGRRTSLFGFLGKDQCCLRRVKGLNIGKRMKDTKMLAVT